MHILDLSLHSIMPCIKGGGIQIVENAVSGKCKKVLKAQCRLFRCISISSFCYVSKSVSEGDYSNYLHSLITHHTNQSHISKPDSANPILLCYPALYTCPSKPDNPPNLIQQTLPNETYLAYPTHKISK